jgi:hypothetical protein
VTPAATIITSPAPRKLPSETAFSAAEVAALLARGDWLFATGDVASARLLYRRAADAGVARAAVRMGETFDPVFSGPPHLRGLDRIRVLPRSGTVAPATSAPPRSPVG